MGEGIGNEADLMPLISSCNIACGGHAGNTTTMQDVVLLALQHQVSIGAHPSYPDTKNFGRITIEITPQELSKSIKNQIADLEQVCKKEGVALHHIKLHGALYNDCARGGHIAKTVLSALEAYKKSLFFYVPAGSIFASQAVNAGYTIKQEAFTDRNYNTDLSLVSRQNPHALINSKEQVLAHLLTMVQKQKVQTLTKTMVAIHADTYCIHGDTPQALQILLYLREQLPKHQLFLKK